MSTPAGAAALLSLEHVTVRFGDVEALRDLSLEVRRGEFVALVGPSGCGKTTLLNLCSGWLTPVSGAVRRPDRVRMVFQQDGLFPWLTARDNVRLGLRHIDAGEARDRRADDLLALVGLQAFDRHYPHQLSGGMRQRVELARALGGDTDLLLMDEPFSSLDYLSRLKLRQELARLLDEQPRTVVLVTHDIEEAAQLADRVLVLSARPATVLDEVRLTSPRPRRATQPDVVAAVHRILAELGLEPDLPADPDAGHGRGAPPDATPAAAVLEAPVSLGGRR